jgi:hypothetical protein
MPPKGQACSPEHRRAISEANKGRRLGKEPCELPKWVPPALVAEFFDCAEIYGEEAAASHIRKLKREMGAAQ